MRTIILALALVAAARSASAQPGQPQPYPPQPAPPQPSQPYPPQPYPPQPYPQQPQPYPPQQQPYAPPPYAYQPGPPLTAEDQEILARGEISDGEYLGGAALSFFIGFGAGQAVQGRWHDTGWIFSLGETASLVAIIGGAIQAADCFDMVNCHRGETPLVLGLIGYVGFRLWGIGDALIGPSSHNSRVRELRMRMGYPPNGPGYYGLKPYLRPPRDGNGGIAGISLSF